jgi:hypothetical protein
MQSLLQPQPPPPRRRAPRWRPCRWACAAAAASGRAPHAAGRAGREVEGTNKGQLSIDPINRADRSLPRAPLPCGVPCCVRHLHTCTRPHVATP